MFGKINLLLIAILLGVSGCNSKNYSAINSHVQPWPAERWQESVKLTDLDSKFKKNLSGAYWNSVTKTLMVVTNKPAVLWRLQRVDDEFTVVGKYILSGDLEAVTQRGNKEDFAFVLDENGLEIKLIKFQGPTKSSEVTTWDISKYLPSSNIKLGPEGMAFVSNKSLRHGKFVDLQGKPRVAKNGIGGLIFVAHQLDGKIYVFDLAKQTNSLDFIGAYATSQNESCALEFDAATGQLYIWHSTDTNYLEVTNLTSVAKGAGRQFQQLQEFLGPRSGNLEGFALVREDGDFDSVFVTDDDNKGNSGLSHYKSFRY